MIPAEIVTRRDVVELVVRVHGMATMLSAGHGDAFHPFEVTLRFAAEHTATPGSLLMPVTVRGPAVAATVEGPLARMRTFLRSSDMPPWLVEVAEWAKTQPRSLPVRRDRVATRAVATRRPSSTTS